MICLFYFPFFFSFFFRSQGFSSLPLASWPKWLKTQISLRRLGWSTDWMTTIQEPCQFWRGGKRIEWKNWKRVRREDRKLSFHKTHTHTHTHTHTSTYKTFTSCWPDTRSCRAWQPRRQWPSRGGWSVTRPQCALQPAIGESCWYWKGEENKKKERLKERKKERKEKIEGKKERKKRKKERKKEEISRKHVF